MNSLDYQQYFNDIITQKQFIGENINTLMDSISNFISSKKWNFNKDVNIATESATIDIRDILGGFNINIVEENLEKENGNFPVLMFECEEEFGYTIWLNNNQSLYKQSGISKENILLCGIFMWWGMQGLPFCIDMTSNYNLTADGIPRNYWDLFYDSHLFVKCAIDNFDIVFSESADD